MLVLETKDGGEEGYLKKLYKPGPGPLRIIGTVVGTILLVLLGSILKEESLTILSKMHYN